MNDPSSRTQAANGAYHRLRKRSLEVNYGRLVNVLAALAERLETEGGTVTETQRRLILQGVRDRADGSGDPTSRPYDLSALVRTSSKVLGLDRDALGRKVLAIVEPDELPEVGPGAGAEEG